MEERKEFCDNCCFFSPEGITNVMDKNECRRHAPVHSEHKRKESYTDTAVWPVVYKDYWCGDWKPKEVL